MQQVNPVEEVVGRYVTVGPAVAAMLILVAVGIGLYVLLAGRDKRLSVRRAGSWLLSLVWALPVLAVLAYVVVQAQPYLGGARVVSVTEHDENSISSAGLSSTDLQLELNDPQPFESRDGAIGTSGKSEDSASEASDFPAGDSSAATTTAAKAPAKTGSSLPDWVRQPPVQEGDETLLALSSEQYATVQLAEEQVLAEAVKKIKKDFHRFHPYSGEWDVPADVVRNQAITLRHVETIDRDLGPTTTRMYRVHLQVKLSPAVRESVYPYWRDQIVTGRLWVLGSLVGLITLMTATTATYLRLDARTDGAYRRRLKLAAVSLIVAGGLVASTIIS